MKSLGALIRENIRIRKYSFVLTIFLLLVANALIAASDTPRVSRAMLAASENSFDSRVSRLWGDNPFVLLGPARGIYLEGYGAVLTAEVNLVTAPVLAMVRPVPIKEEVDKHRRMKLERVPELRRAMRKALIDTAASLDTVPAEEQIVVVAFLSRYPWEDVTGMPVQIMMRAQKKQLLEIQRSGAKDPDAALQSLIQVVEF